MEDQEEPMATGTEEEDDIIINEADGLPNLHPNYGELETTRPDGGTKTLAELVYDEDLPCSLIVTNLSSSLFKNDEEKQAIEAVFSQFGEATSFQYFRSFRRMRVNFTCPSSAAKARVHLHQACVGASVISCYFAQPVSPIDSEDQHLHPPALTKQFLISPPASPPFGWEQKGEADPLVNYDLLAAIANLSPGETHELHPPSGSQPGIVVHVCEETAGATPEVPGQPKQRIVGTPCPKSN